MSLTEERMWTPWNARKKGKDRVVSVSFTSNAALEINGKGSRIWKRRRGQNIRSETGKEKKLASERGDRNEIGDLSFRLGRTSAQSLNTGDTALLGVGWGVMHRPVMETSCTFRTGVLPEKNREREREKNLPWRSFLLTIGRGEEETAKVDVPVHKTNGSSLLRRKEESHQLGSRWSLCITRRKKHGG